LARKIRTFIAVDIPDSIREKIARLQAKLKEKKANVKWVRPQTIHITLKFLGDVEEERIDEIGEAIERAVKGFQPFTAFVGGAGRFPNDRKPRVLWVGVKKGGNALSELADRIENECAQLGFEKGKRKYSAHLTLGRVRSSKNIGSVVEAMNSMEFEGGFFEASEVLIMKSDLKPTGAVYTVLKKIKLQG